MSDLMQIPNWLDNELGNMFQTISETTDSEFEVEGNINEIEHQSRDGFIPFTNGGVHFNAPININYLTGTGKGFVNEVITAKIDKTVDYSHKEALKAFIEANRKALNDLFTAKQLDSNSGDINYHTLYSLHNGPLAEDLSETESSWLDNTLFIEHRAHFYSAENYRNETGADEICFMSGVNTDYEYGRDKGLDITYEQTFKVKDLTPSVLETILKSMLQSI